MKSQRNKTPEKRKCLLDWKKKVSEGTQIMETITRHYMRQRYSQEKKNYMERVRIVGSEDLPEETGNAICEPCNRKASCEGSNNKCDEL